MTGIFRLIVMSIVMYVVYAILRRFFQPLAGKNSARARSSRQQKKYSPKDGAIDADFEEIE